jgi:hypothetical protein
MRDIKVKIRSMDASFRQMQFWRSYIRSSLVLPYQVSLNLIRRALILSMDSVYKATIIYM